MNAQQPKSCPNCALLNPPVAQRCDCGFQFQLGQSYPRPRYAGFWLRFLADLLDGLIALAFAAPVHYFFDRPVLGAQEFWRPRTWSDFGLSHVVFGAFFLYNMTYLVSRTGQSYGRRAVGIRVQDSRTGSTIGFLRTLARNLFAGVSAAIVYLGFLWLLIDPRKQTWHDKVFNTVVVRSTS